MELIVSTPEQLRSIFIDALESYRINKQAPILSQQPKEPFLTRNEAAKMLKVSLQTLHTWTANGTLKSYSIGGRVLYKNEDIESALTEVKTAKY